MDILYRVCNSCHGKGKYRRGRVLVPCLTCKGKGYILTELGQHVQIFLSKFCRNE